MILKYFKTFFIGCAFTIGAMAQDNADKNQELKEILDYTVKKYQIPGVIAGVANEKGFEFIGASGLRKYDDYVALTPEDKIHLGSCTKAITSVLIAKLVELKKVKWNTTIIDVFPRLKKIIHEDYNKVTLHDLVTHTGGIKADASDWAYKRNIGEKGIDEYFNSVQTTNIFTAKGRAYNEENKLSARRYFMMVDNLKNAPSAEKGKFNYSHLGYVIAASMVEKITESSWEELIQEHVFTPLKMESAGFGYPNTDGKIDQPYGHKMVDEKWVPVEGDKDPSFGPAGTIHCTITDWYKVLSLFLEKNKNTDYLDKKQLKFLADPKGKYACGWNIKSRFWAYGKTLSHLGSNSLWLSTAWIAPKINKVFIVSLNSFDSQSNKTIKKILSQMLDISIEDLEEKRQRHIKEEAEKKLKELKKKKN